MRSSVLRILAIAGSFLLQLTFAQQFAGDYINNSLPYVPGSEIAFFKIKDNPSGTNAANNNLTLINYYSTTGTSGKRLDTSKIQRVVIFIHGLNRDPGTYMSNMLSALSQATTQDPNVNFSSVQIICPYFPNGDDKNVGYPWTAGLASGLGSTSNALVWKGSQWASGSYNQYPNLSGYISSYDVLDQLIVYYDNKTLFPAVNQIIIAGHSLGAQTVQRYAAVGKLPASSGSLASQPTWSLAVTTPVTYWIGNPNSYVWFTGDRPLSTSTCSTYDNWREGLYNYTQYPMTYGRTLAGYGTSKTQYNATDAGRANVLKNYQMKNKAYARGLLDTGDDSSTCAPSTTGANRNERFFNFIKKFPPTCTSGGQCDTVDFVNAGHDGGAMMASAAGLARLFFDNFYGNGSRAYDFGYPRVQAGDDPFPNPGLNATSAANKTVYAGNVTYGGCWTDSGNTALTTKVYDWQNNTVELCTSTCNNLGYNISGVEFGSQCFCGNYLTAKTQQTVDQGCTQACTGNSSEVCGGYGRMSVYANGTPYQLPDPETPENVGNYLYSNCYTDNQATRFLTGPKYTSNSMTLESCAAFCNGYQYFGVEYASECYCGSYFTSGTSIASDGRCSMVCAGNNLELCGGSYGATVYQLSPDAVVSTIIQASTSTTSTTAAATPTSTLLCPATDGQTIADANNNTYTVHCSSDSTVGSYGNAAAAGSYLDCMTACDSSKGCNAFTYVGGAYGSGSGTCWLKTSMGSLVSQGNNYISGVLNSTGSTDSSGSSSSSVSVSASTTAASGASSVSAATSTTSATATASALSCPTSNNTVYTASTGATFLIECGIDHAGGDIGSTWVSSLSACIEACAANSACIDVSMLGAGCYMKGTLGAAGSSSAVNGAKLITSASSSSSSSSSAVSSITISSSSVSPSSTALSTATSSSAVSPSVTSTTSSAASVATSGSCAQLSASASTATDVNGKTWSLECGTDRAGGDLSSGTATSFAGCFALCDSTPNCIGFSFVGGSNGGPCYMKSSKVSASSNSNVDSAWIVAVSSSSSSVSSTTSSSASSSSQSSASTSASSSSFASSSISSVDASSSSSAVSSTSSSSSTSALTSSSDSSVVPSSTSSSTSSTDLPSSLSTTSSATSSSSLASSTTDSSSSTISSLSSSTSSAAPDSSSSSSAASSTSSSSSSSTVTSSSSSSVVSSTLVTSTTSSASLSSSTSSSVTSTSASSSALAALPSGFTSLGCYIDNIGGQRALSYSNGTSSTNTPTQCAQNCRALGYKYSGTEYSQECYCSNSQPANLTASTDCKMACTGDKTQTCGAGNRLSVVVDNTWKQTFFARANYGTWNLMSCYVDSSSSRTLAKSVSLSAFGGGSNATVANCLDACAKSGLSYCGAEYYSECYGATVAPTAAVATGVDPLAAGCNYPCKGNSTEACGGSNRVLVYINNGTSSSSS